MSRDIQAVVFGVLVSTLLAGTLVIAGLKAGITPGVSPLVVLVAWGGFMTAVHSAGGKRFLNLAQVAGSAGTAVTAGVIFTAPLVQILYQVKGLPVPQVDVASLILLSLAGALVGFGFVGLSTKKFLSDPTLPAPEARACTAMIDAAVQDKEQRPKLGRSLYTGVALGVLAPMLTYVGLAQGSFSLFSRSTSDGSRSAGIALPLAPVYIGIGGLLTLSTALLVFGGSFIRLAGDWLLAGLETGTQGALQFPANSMRWVGGGAMTVAVAYSLLKFTQARLGQGQMENEELITIDPGRRKWQVLSIALGLVVVLGWLFTSGASLTFSLAMAGAILVMATLMVTLGAILSLQIGSSASPVSGTIFVTTLVLCLVALAVGHTRIEDVMILTPLLVAACVAVCTANDSSQDYKTLQLCGVRVQDGFLAQILGLIGGAVVVPIVLYIAHNAYTLGSPDLPAPQGQMFATLIDGLLLQSALPWYPICVGLALGALAVGLDIAGKAKGIQLPSMALAVGIYLPAAIGIGILIGSLFRRWGEAGLKKSRSEVLLAAAGLITGAAMLDLVLGGMIVGGFDLQSLNLFPNVPSAVSGTVCLLGILILGLTLYRNAKGGGRPA